jgi:asparagine synthetase B (glutamine-hydrolysing)
VPKMPWYFDESFADSSQLPTYLDSRLAREKVTVSLSGDGGDELFSSYDRYAWSENIQRVLAAASRSLRRIMLIDTLSYLPDDILVKVDRASMAVSLESRILLLDHRMFDFAWRLLFSMKVRGKDSKWLLRRVLGRHVPREIIERPRMGFAVPISLAER